MDPKESWDTDDQPLSPREVTTYQRAICKLMYLMLAIRPDIAFAVTTFY